MPRSRVLSFMSQWGSAPRSTTAEDGPRPTPSPQPEGSALANRRLTNIDTTTPRSSATKLDAYASPTPHSPSALSRARGDSRAPRPNSMMQTYQPPQVEVAQDTPPELAPIFSFLNSHSNKLYQEGYFLKLHDLDSRGRPSTDRSWNECFAQLVGTVLSLWDAAALDAAGEDGEVVPTFINLSDASIKMIESLPMNGTQSGNLQNVLSISTAANNRYLLHFNSLSSLTQWTAGIRLAMLEHSTLQEAYTGSLIAGKGRYLNNIKQIMARSRFSYADWARVRFGAGTPWQRCWCVVSPPDEKEYHKAQKVLRKASAYDRTSFPKGDIKFYDTRKITKKTRPIATISDAYAAYAIYPQSKPLIDQSTLVKLEGLVTIHTSPESTTEGFVFVMPEVHPAVTGFEMMLRWLFPVFDTFGLYGRPSRLIADTLDQRGLMFALPRDRRYGYLDILDVSGLIHTKGSQAWSERQWRREMKKLTAERMTTQMETSPPTSRAVSQRRNAASRISLPAPRTSVRFGDDPTIHSSPGSRSASPVQFVDEENRPPGPRRTDSAPPEARRLSPHKRSISEARGYRTYITETPSRLSHDATVPSDEDTPPAPPKHGGARDATTEVGEMDHANTGRSRGPGTLERIISDSAVPTMATVSPHLSPPEPVGSPPAFTHQPNSRPPTQPYEAPELRRAHSNVDAATLYQMQDAIRPSQDGAERGNGGAWTGEVQLRQQNTVASTHANHSLGALADRSQGVANRTQRNPQQRLSTIPGSPFVSQETEHFHPSTQTGLHQMNGVAEEPRNTSNYVAQDGSTPEPAAVLKSSSSEHSIARKPTRNAPRATSTEQGFPQTSFRRSISGPASGSSPVDSDGWEGGVIDEAALNRILDASDDRNSTMQSKTTTSTEPDYASTTGASTKDEKVSPERPRAGKLKTVGDPNMPKIEAWNGDAGRSDTGQAGLAAPSADIPQIDFGHTYSYKPDSRPGTSGTLTAADALTDKRRSRSADHMRQSSRDRLSGNFGGSARVSPNESNRHSYFAERNTPSPGGRATPSDTNRLSYFSARNTPSPGGRATPTGFETWNEPGNSNNVAWQPGLSPGGGQRNRNSITPEQWVQQKAAMAQQPQYIPPRKAVPAFAHNRQTSHGSVQQRRKLTKTPPLSRSKSGDWTQQAPQQAPPGRPQSRGASMNFDTAGAGASLSAKEQMHVSRATGTPLINMTTNPANQQQQAQSGLVGHVAARERDRASASTNMHNTAVQQAIVERQQQQLRVDAELQARAQAVADAKARYRMQWQATHQAQEPWQTHQQVVWNNMAPAQNQVPANYGPQYHQQRPQVQQQNSWPLPPGPAQYGPGGFPQQEYGASFYNKQHQQYGGQGWQQR